MFRSSIALPYYEVLTPARSLDDPYETPSKADVSINLEDQTVSESVHAIIMMLESSGAQSLRTVVQVIVLMMMSCHNHRSALEPVIPLKYSLTAISDRSLYNDFADQLNHRASSHRILRAPHSTPLPKMKYE